MRGEIFSLLGHNGAGKTTTIKMLSGIESASGGSIRFAMEGEFFYVPLHFTRILLTI
jgi:ABC-2 type transport system ATP-binding protein